MLDRLAHYLCCSLHLAPAIMIAIVNYEMGNLRSVEKALEQVGHVAEITDDPQRLAAADKIILPGVGAYADAMVALNNRGLVEPLRELVASGKPTLGICLGMQLLFERSYEDGEHEGLGILPGEVRRFEVPHGVKVPHMGWNQLDPTRPSPLMEGLDPGSYFYFVHSYYVVPADQRIVATTTNYPEPFCSSLHQGNLMATQFHPEKSQQVGLAMLANFASL
jgi:imidazole glycerol-phosphate synthase subunit HisH